MATGAILAVAVAVLTSTTLTPAVLATFGRAAAKRSSWLHCLAPARDHAVAVLDPLGRLGDATAVAVGASAAATFLLALAAPAFSMVLGNSLLRQFEPTHEIRGGVSAAARGARARRARTGPGAGDVPRRQRQRARAHGAPLDAVQQKMTQAPERRHGVARRCSATTTAARCCRRCSRSIPRTLARATTVDWMRAQAAAGAGAGTRSRRRRTDRADQGLRRPGGARPSRWCSGSSR